MAVTLEGGMVANVQNACWDCLWVPELPQQVEFVVLARFCGLRDDFTEETAREMEVYFLGPGMESLIDPIQFELPTGEPDDDHPEGWEVSALVPLLIRFTAKSEGAYGLDFYINGKYQRTSIAFRIKLGSPPTAHPG